MILFIFVFTLCLLITVHEFGHYWVAKQLGIKVLRFSIGFGKPLWRWQRPNSTEFVIGWCLLGGYVRMLDEREGEVATADLPYAFNRQSLAKRAAVIFAGPAFNILFAALVYWFVYTAGIINPLPIVAKVLPNSIAAEAKLPENSEIVAVNGEQVSNWRDIAFLFLRSFGAAPQLTLRIKNLTTERLDYIKLNITHWKLDELHPDLLTSLGITYYRPTGALQVVKVIPQSPAATAGLLAGDKLMAINGATLTSYQQLIRLLTQGIGESSQFLVQRDQKTFKKMITVPAKRYWFLFNKPYLGIQFKPALWPAEKLRLHQYPFWSAWQPALIATKQVFYINIVVLKKLILGDLTFRSLGGPISLWEGTAAASKQGWLYYLDFLALLSISLAVFNLMPIPGLDGAQLLLLAIEMVRGQAVSVRVQLLFFRLGIIALMLLMVQTLVNDLLRLP